MAMSDLFARVWRKRTKLEEALRIFFFVLNKGRSTKKLTEVKCLKIGNEEKQRGW